MTEQCGFVLSLRSIARREIKYGRADLGHIINAAADKIEQVQAERDQAIAQFERTAAAQGWQRTDEQSAPQAFVEAKQERDAGWPELEQSDANLRTCATCGAVLAPGPQPANTYERSAPKIKTSEEIIDEIRES